MGAEPIHIGDSMKTNFNFAKLKNRIPTFAPSPLRVVTHHHEEYDVDIIDEETGEPTGEKEHIVNDWDTYETPTRATAADYLKMGWLPVVDKAPKAEEGHYVRKTGFADEVDGHIIMEYEQVPLPAPPPRTFRRSYLAQWINTKGKWDTFEAFLQSSPEFAFLWTYSTEFDENNAMWPTAIAAFQQVLQLTDNEVDEMLEFGVNGVE